MQSAELVETHNGVDEAFLCGTRFCEVSDPDIAWQAAALRGGTDRETAVAVFGFVRDAISYEVGNWQRTAAETLRRRRGTCTNCANLMVAMLRSLGIPAGYGVMTVRGREYFGPAIPPRLCSKVGARSRHLYVCVWLDGRWLRCDPSDDDRFARAAQHVNPQCTLVEWDGAEDALLSLEPSHVVEDRYPLADVDALMARPMRLAMRLPVHIGNYFIEFMREYGAGMADAQEVHRSFEQWLTWAHPVCYLAYRTLPAR